MHEDLATIEREFTLLARYQMMAYKRDRARLDRSAYLVLTRLEIEGPLSVGQLAEAFGLDTSTVTRQTASMLRSGLIERVPDPAGGGARKLSTTKVGSERLAADRVWACEGLGRLVDDWPEEDIHRLAEALTQFNTSIERHEGRDWPRPALQHAANNERS